MNASFDNPNAQRQTGEGWPTAPLSADIPICILAGGLSTRLRPLTETMPKPMVPVAGKPFVQHVLEHLGRLGFRRFILAVSYLWEQIYDYFGDGGQFGWELKYSVEPNALGTGGAVLWAQKFWSYEVLVANGDTYLPEDFRHMLALHRKAGEPATMALINQDDCSRFGRVKCIDGRVTAFCEKDGTDQPGWINAGIYILSRRAFGRYRPGEAFSLERDIFPSLCPGICAYFCHTAFADIGTHQSLSAFRSRSLLKGATHE